MDTSAPRRLIDLPGIADLETKALMKPRYADIYSRAEFPEIDETSTAVFGLTADEAEAIVLPADWDGIEQLEGRDAADAFEAEGWDVTDNKRRPLRMLPQFALQLALAMRGVAGELPFQMEEKQEESTLSLAKEAAKFKRDKR
ncbi:MAG: hypothetical protein JWP35_3380 [Caulobacter sp.]|nr:hypothetical protein [Caulobacter sp.]